MSPGGSDPGLWVISMPRPAGPTSTSRAAPGAVRDFVVDTANLLESGRRGFHTPPSRFEACRLIGRHHWPVLSAGTCGGADLLPEPAARIGASIMIVSRRSRVHARYANS